MARQTSEPASGSDSKVYEMFTYSIKPKAFDQFMELTQEYIPLKPDNNSKLKGYWITDIGGLNEVVHIWEYDSYAQRAEAKEALSQHEAWINNYINKIQKMIVKQDNMVMTAVPWSDVKPPLSTSGVYELRMYDIVLGKREEWEQKLIQGLPERCKLCEPVGTWFTEFGPCNTAIMLWSYQSLDDRVRIRKESQKMTKWVEAVRDCLPLETKAFAKVLTPTSFSPWK